MKIKVWTCRQSYLYPVLHIDISQRQDNPLSNLIGNNRPCQVVHQRTTPFWSSQHQFVKFLRITTVLSIFSPRLLQELRITLVFTFEYNTCIFIRWNFFLGYLEFLGENHCHDHCQLLFELLRKFGSISSRITETVEYVVSVLYCYISQMMNYFWSVVFPFLSYVPDMIQLHYGWYNISICHVQHPVLYIFCIGSAKSGSSCSQ